MEINFRWAETMVHHRPETDQMVEDLGMISEVTKAVLLQRHAQIVLEGQRCLKPLRQQIPYAYLQKKEGPITNNAGKNIDQQIK